MFTCTFSLLLPSEMTATAQIAVYQKSISHRPASEEKAPSNVFAETQLSETEVGMTGHVCAQMRREHIASTYERMDACPVVATSDGSSDLESPVFYKNPQATHYRDASAEQLSDAEISIPDNTYAKMHQNKPRLYYL